MAEDQPAEEVLTPGASDVQADPEQHRPERAAEVARLDVPGDEFRAMDVLDEAQILDALQGRPSQVMVYHFDSGGKKQTGLSYAGVAECVRTMNVEGFTKIRIAPEPPPIIEEVQETNEQGELVTFIQATVYAEDERNGGGQWGTARQPKFQTYRDRNRKPTLDPFAVAKALSKAQRNALLPLVPVAFRETLIAQMLGDEARVKQIKAGAGAEREALLPPPLDDERAKALRDMIFGVYDELKGMNRLALLPGQFNVKLQRAQHDHRLLDALLEELRSRLEHERRKETDAATS